MQAIEIVSMRYKYHAPLPVARSFLNRGCLLSLQASLAQPSIIISTRFVLRTHDACFTGYARLVQQRNCIRRARTLPMHHWFSTTAWLSLNITETCYKRRGQWRYNVNLNQGAHWIHRIVATSAHSCLPIQAGDPGVCRAAASRAGLQSCPQLSDVLVSAASRFEHVMHGVPECSATGISDGMCM